MRPIGSLLIISSCSGLHLQLLLQTLYLLFIIGYLLLEIDHFLLEVLTQQLDLHVVRLLQLNLPTQDFFVSHIQLFLQVGDLLFALLQIQLVLSLA